MTFYDYSMSIIGLILPAIYLSYPYQADFISNANIKLTARVHPDRALEMIIYNTLPITLQLDQVYKTSYVCIKF